MLFKRILKISKYIILSTAIIFVIALIAVNLPFSQRIISEQANNIFIKRKLPVQVDRITLLINGKVGLRNIRIFDNEQDTIVYAEKINLSARLLPLLSRKIIVKKITINGAVVNISTDSISGKPDIVTVFTGTGTQTGSGEKNGAEWEISGKSAELENIRFSYTDSRKGLTIAQSVGKLRIGLDDLSILRKQIYVGFIELENARGGITIRNQIDDEAVAAEIRNPAQWNFKLNRSDFKNVLFTLIRPDENQRMKFELGHGQLSDAGFELAEMRIRAGKTEIRNGSVRRTILDANSGIAERTDTLVISDINTLINDFFLFRGNLQFDMSELSMALEKRLILEQGKITMISDSATGSKVHADLRTNSSRTTISIEAGRSVTDIIRSFRNVPFSLKIEDTEIATTDILALFPTLKEQPSWTKMQESIIGFRCDVSGTVNNLNLNGISFNTSSGFSFSASGTIAGLTTLNSSFCSLAFQTSEINPVQVSDLLSLFGVASELPRFEPMSVAGTIDSSLMKPFFSIDLKSNHGKLAINGSLNIPDKRYVLKMAFAGIEAGKIASVKELGRLSGNLELEGMEFDPQKMELITTLYIDSADFRGYDYSGINIKANGKKGIFLFDLNADDKNIKFGLQGSVSINDSSYKGRLKGLIDFDAGKLNLYKGTSVSSMVEAELGKSAEILEGSLNLSDLVVTRDNKRENLSNLSFSFITTDTLTSSRLETDFINANGYYRGSPGGLIKVIKENRLAGFAALDSAVGNRIPYIYVVPELNISLESFYDPFIGLFVSDSIFSFGNLSASAIKDSTGNANMKIRVDRIKSGRNELSGAEIILESLPGKSVIGIKADSIRLDMMSFSDAGLSISVEGDSAIFSLKADNMIDSLFYDIEGTARKSSGRMSIGSSGFRWVINGFPWNISGGDFLVLEPANKDFVADLHLRNGSHSIDFYGRKSDKLYIETKDLLLKMMMIPGMREFPYDASLTGKAELIAADGKTELILGMDIKEIRMDETELGYMNISGTLFSDTIGNMKSDFIAVINDTAGIKFSIRGEGSTKEKIIRSELSDIQVHNFEPLVSKYISGLRGQVSGNLEVILSENKPKLNGEMKINGIRLKLIPVNAWYYLSDDVIKIENNTLKFNRFTVQDSMKNPLTLNGSVDLRDPVNILTDLQITSDHIQLMNTTGKDNAVFNGDIFIDSRLNFRGPLQKPSIDGNIVLAEGTVINYRYAENLSVSETQKTITFAALDPELQTELTAKPVSSQLSGSPDIEATVEINPRSLFNFQVSKGFDIGLSITGGGFLTYSLMPNKEIDLSGIYEISQGSSQLKIPGWPRKDFIITKGSTVKWDGKIDDPDLNLETTSNVRGSYVNPVDNKTREVSFLVYMKLTGRFSELEINFDVRSADQYITTFFNTLSTDERMKQAINLLIFERVELPGQTSSSNYLTQQISQFAENQLNQATKSASKKLDLDVSVGLDTYTQATTTGEQTTTSLSYQVRKEMFKERGSVLLSGHTNYNTTASQQTNAVIENFIFEYAIDTNRTKFLKVYRQQNYEDLLEGEVIKSGVGFIYRKNYDRLSDIWRREKRSKK